MKKVDLRTYSNNTPVIAGLLFFMVNAWVSYEFYHANSYKILVVLISVTILFLYQDVFLFKSTPSGKNWRYYLILCIPLAATFPGFIYHRGNYNYNFDYELTTNLVLILWSIYLIRCIRSDRNFKILIVFIGITIIYASLYAYLEWSNLNPFLPFNENVTRVKATFGNINYFAGFLITLIPLFGIANYL